MPWWGWVLAFVVVVAVVEAMALARIAAISDARIARARALAARDTEREARRRA